MKGSLLVLVLAVLAACNQSESTDVSSTNSPARVSFEFRLAQAAPQAGMIPMVVEGETLYVASQAALTEADVKHARVSSGQRGQPLIEVQFRPAGAKRFADLTTANVGKRVAILIDGRVISAPTIASPID